MNNSDIQWGDREKLAVFLDLRIVADVEKIMPDDIGKSAWQNLKETYIDEWIQVHGHEYDSARSDSAGDETPGGVSGFLARCLGQQSHARDMEMGTNMDNIKRTKAESEFTSSFVEWLKLSRKVIKILTEKQVEEKAKTENECSSVEIELWTTIKLDIAPFYREAECQQILYGLFPRLARKYVGNLMSESFCERVISAANDVLTKGNTLLDCNDINMMCTLRMNRTFMLDYVDTGDINRLVTSPITVLDV